MKFAKIVILSFIFIKWHINKFIYKNIYIYIETISKIYFSTIYIFQKIYDNKEKYIY